MGLKQAKECQHHPNGLVLDGFEPTNPLPQAKCLAVPGCEHPQELTFPGYRVFTCVEPQQIDAHAMHAAVRHAASKESHMETQVVKARPAIVAPTGAWIPRLRHAARKLTSLKGIAIEQLLGCLNTGAACMMQTLDQPLKTAFEAGVVLNLVGAIGRDDKSGCCE